MVHSIRHFRYTVPDWCNRLFGAELDTAGLVAAAKELDTDLDLIPYDEADAVAEANVQMSCVLPVMGKDENGEDFIPFFPGFNSGDYDNVVRAALNEALDHAAKYGIRFVICFTGYDNGAPRAEQFARVVAAYQDASSGESLIQKAGRLGVTFVMEMLNTLGDDATWRGHPGYLGDNSEELIEQVIRKVNSPNLRLAFDIYHVEMMGEDPIALIEKHHDVIGYIHVAGIFKDGENYAAHNRGELNWDDQKVDYPPILAAAAKHLPKDTYVLLEYIPNTSTSEEITSNLQEAIEICEAEI